MAHKRFLVFGYLDWECGGIESSLLGSFDTSEEALKLTSEKEYGNYEVFDRVEGQFYKIEGKSYEHTLPRFSGILGPQGPPGPPGPTGARGESCHCPHCAQGLVTPAD